jgi:uncharacterized membrane protein
MLDEPHEISTASSETVSSAVLEEAIVEERAADVQVIQRITRFHSGPLPDAETLSAYAKLILNGADRVMSLVERQTTHRHERESADARQTVRGHWMAYTLAMALSGAGVYLGLRGHDWLAAALLTTTVGAVIAALVVDKKPRDLNPTARNSSDT